MIYVIDSGAILNNFSFYFHSAYKYVTTEEIIAEMKDLRSKLLIESALREHILQILAPSQKTLEEIRKLAQTVLHKRLSAADISVIALAKDLSEKNKVVVITDDYAVQNILSILGIPYEGVLMPGIRETLTYYRECQNCGKVFPIQYLSSICDVCSSPIKLKKKKYKQN